VREIKPASTDPQMQTLADRINANTLANLVTANTPA
jgi:hypothetical protein